MLPYWMACTVGLTRIITIFICPFGGPIEIGSLFNPYYACFNFGLLTGFVSVLSIAVLFLRSEIPLNTPGRLMVLLFITGISEQSIDALTPDWLWLGAFLALFPAAILAWEAASKTMMPYQLQDKTI